MLAVFLITLCAVVIAAAGRAVVDPRGLHNENGDSRK